MTRTAALVVPGAEEEAQHPPRLLGRGLFAFGGFVEELQRAQGFPMDPLWA